jgi:hypothetical protein
MEAEGIAKFWKMKVRTKSASTNVLQRDAIASKRSSRLGGLWVASLIVLSLVMGVYITGFAFRDELRCAQDESCTDLKYFSKKRKIFSSVDHGVQAPAKAP